MSGSYQKTVAERAPQAIVNTEMRTSRTGRPRVSNTSTVQS